MYNGVSAAGLTGGSLAATGVAAGSWILAVVGLIFLGVGVYMLLKKNSRHRP
jgi:LPXTG-motif cell wall-anchored protein